jgi:transposase-like protein
MTIEINDTGFSSLAKVLSEQGLEGLGSAVEILINEAMKIERTKHINAQLYERSEMRSGYANGFKPKQLNTRIGALNLQVPQVRNGDFYPSFLERGLRSERALSLSLAEMYIQGVSTRKVGAILEEMCGFEVSSQDVSRASKLLDEEFIKWRERPLGQYVYLILDARYEKVRQGGQVIDSAVLIAYGVDCLGARHVLGLSILLSEAEVHWRKFLESLVTRGLHGVQLITSDAHSGLKSALKAVFPSVPWQRCQFHLQQNAQSYVPKQNMKKEVSEDIRTIFNAPNKVEADRQLSLMISKYEKTAPKLSEWMENAIPEGLTVFNFKVSHRVRLRTTNLAERVNREIKRRTNIVNIFPNVASCERLITGILIEISEGWGNEQTYLSMKD